MTFYYKSKQHLTPPGNAKLPGEQNTEIIFSELEVLFA
jgi:hypothetical protein